MCLLRLVVAVVLLLVGLSGRGGASAAPQQWHALGQGPVSDTATCMCEKGMAQAAWQIHWQTQTVVSKLSQAPWPFPCTCSGESVQCG
jgi:hypothetical protein